MSRPPVADLDRRLHAFAVDTLAGWALGAVAAVLLVLVGDVAVSAAVAVAVLVALAATVTAGLLDGTTGASPGKRTSGLRVVDVAGDSPVGALRGAIRGLVLWLSGAPTLGLGAAVLAWSAAADPQGRGWHDRTTASRVVARPRPAPPDPAPPAAPEQAMINLTALRLRAAAAPAPASAAADVTPGAPPPPVAAHPGGGVPGADVRTRTPRRAVSHDWRVTFDTGESLVVEGLGLLGRGPAARPGEPVAHLVPLRSEDMSLSKTHAQFHVAGDGALVVIDRGSTNGSVLVRKGLSRELRPGRPTTLLDGDRVRFGDREMRVSREA